MKFAVTLVAAACVGALMVIAFPTTLVTAASVEMRQIHLADLNPFGSIFDYGQKQIREGMNNDDLGLHRSTVHLAPATIPPPASLKLDLSRAYEVQAQSQIDQAIRHTQDAQAYTRDPWHQSGPPPN
jgi:hypothetical protein